MEIIEELEPTRRGPYAGAVGYFSFLAMLIGESLDGSSILVIQPRRPTGSTRPVPPEARPAGIGAKP